MVPAMRLSPASLADQQISRKSDGVENRSLSHSGTFPKGKEAKGPGSDLYETFWVVSARTISEPTLKKLRDYVN
jgi:hypothetical protein